MLTTLFFFCLSALIVISVPLWRNVFLNWQNTGSLMVSRPVDSTPFGMLDVVLMFFFWLAGQAVAMILITQLFGIRIEELGTQPGDTQSWAVMVMATSQFVATLVAVGVYFLRYRTFNVIGWYPNTFGRDVVLGLFAFAMVIPVILFLQWLLVFLMDYQHPTMDLLKENATGLTLLATWFSAVLIAPICEEIFFRGVLQRWLQRLSVRGASDQVLIGGWDPSDGRSKMAELNNGSGAGLAKPGGKETKLDSTQPIWPIVVTSILFGLAHAGQGPAPFTLFLFGIALGYLFRATGSIVCCIVLHMMLNAFSMFWFTIQVFLGELATDVAERVQAACVAW